MQKAMKYNDKPGTIDKQNRLKQKHWQPGLDSVHFKYADWPHVSALDADWLIEQNNFKK